MNFLRWLLPKMAEEFLRISNLTLEIKFVQKNLQQIGKGFYGQRKISSHQSKRALSPFLTKLS